MRRKRPQSKRGCLRLVIRLVGSSETNTKRKSTQLLQESLLTSSMSQITFLTLTPTSPTSPTTPISFTLLQLLQRPISIRKLFRPRMVLLTCIKIQTPWCHLFLLLKNNPKFNNSMCNQRVSWLCSNNSRISYNSRS